VFISFPLLGSPSGFSQENVIGHSFVLKSRREIIVISSLCVDSLYN